jgi:hypothetical protein
MTTDGRAETPRTLTIARRFNGPPDSGNGGYVCGAFAVAVGDDVRVRLLAPPPLERPLTIGPGDKPGTWMLRDGETPVAAAVAAHLELEVPSAPPYVQAVWAAQHYVGFRGHSFPDCFVCGPHRRRGDGLRIFAGPLDSGIVAAPWLPADDLDRGDGKAAVEFHWAALDCPGYFAVVEDNPRMMLLGEMQAHVDRRVRVGEPCTVIGWKLGTGGRKHYCGTAIFDGEGELCARARATWVEPKSSG